MKNKTYFAIVQFFGRGDEWTEKFKIDEATLIDFATRFQDKVAILADWKHPDHEQIYDEFDKYMNEAGDAVDILDAMYESQHYNNILMQDQIIQLQTTGQLHLNLEEAICGIGVTKEKAYAALIEGEDDNGWD
jgi:hypothetical protein